MQLKQDKYFIENLPKKRKRVFLTIFSLAFVICILSIFSGGEKNYMTMYNNGDFNRVMKLCHLSFMDRADMTNSVSFVKIDRYKINLPEKIKFSDICDLLFSVDDIRSYPTVQIIFVRLAVAAGILINKIRGADVHIFSIYVLGVMLCFLYAVAVSSLFTNALLKKGKTDRKTFLKYAVFMLLSLVILCDIGYLQYFNSLYAEGIQHIFFIFTLSRLVKAYRLDFGIFNTLMFSLDLLIFSTSKFFNIPAAFFIAFSYFVVILKNMKNKGIILHIMPVVLSLVLSVVCLSFTPKWMKKSNIYNTVFFGVLRHTEDDEAKKYLSQLGLDESMSDLKDTHYFTTGVYAASKKYDFKPLNETSFFKVCLLYVKNPGRLVNVTDYIAKHAKISRHVFFLDDSFRKSHIKLNIWSHIRENMRFDSFYFYLVLVIMTIFVLVKRKVPKTAILFGLMCLGYSFYLPFFLNGDADLAKHLYLFMEIMDICIIYLFYNFLFSLKREVKKDIIPIGIFTFIIFFGSFHIYRMAPTVEFGIYENRPLIWEIISEKDGVCTLLSKENIKNSAFSKDSNNDWRKSGIREFLNGEFLKSFTKEEISEIVQDRHKILLTRNTKDEAEEGNMDFYCNPRPDFCKENFDSAYGVYVQDKVAIPSVKDIDLMRKNKIRYDKAGDFWLDTVYFYRDDTNRYVADDSNIYKKISSDICGVRPVIKVKKSYIESLKMK